jgi:hypothetical protein
MCASDIQHPERGLFEVLPPTVQTLTALDNPTKEGLQRRSC